VRSPPSPRGGLYWQRGDVLRCVSAYKKRAAVPMGAVAAPWIRQTARLRPIRVVPARGYVFQWVPYGACPRAISPPDGPKFTDVAVSSAVCGLLSSSKGAALHYDPTPMPSPSPGSGDNLADRQKTRASQAIPIPMGGMRAIILEVDASTSDTRSRCAF